MNEENIILNSKLSEINVELEEWKKNYFELENESKNHKSHVEHVKKAGIHEKTNFQAEIYKLNETIELKNREIEELTENSKKNEQDLLGLRSYYNF